MMTCCQVSDRPFGLLVMVSIGKHKLVMVSLANTTWKTHLLWFLLEKAKASVFMVSLGKHKLVYNIMMVTVGKHKLVMVSLGKHKHVMVSLRKHTCYGLSE